MSVHIIGKNDAEIWPKNKAENRKEISGIAGTNTRKEAREGIQSWQIQIQNEHFKPGPDEASDSLLPVDFAWACWELAGTTGQIQLVFWAVTTAHRRLTVSASCETYKTNFSVLYSAYLFLK